MTKFNNLTQSICIINMLIDNTINLVVGNATSRAVNFITGKR